MARTPDHESRTSGSVARAEMAPRTKKRSSFGAIASAVMLSISLVGCGIGGVMLGEATTTEVVKHAHWSYAGKDGPDRWAELDPHWSACSNGRTQSPIDIAPAKLLKAEWLEELRFAYKDTKKLEVLNNGHTIQVTPERGNWLNYNKVWYELKQWHFHAPSEHTLVGMNTEMEVHFVHAADANRLAVIGVMLKLGPDNAFLDQFWDSMPAEEGKKADWSGGFSILDALPDDRTFYTYKGSLTTPPCSETVTWLVMKQPMTVSKSQVEKFKAIAHGNTNRPVQPLYGRVISESVPGGLDGGHGAAGSHGAADSHGAAPAAGAKPGAATDSHGSAPAAPAAGAMPAAGADSHGAAPAAAGAADSHSAAPAPAPAAPAAAAAAKH
ncbi:MAG: carbonic anhydrase family protein [Proteobacteria bacterium]|nr:carbonic anhydrase family protein [Pseudomonadota bacterium]